MANRFAQKPAEPGTFNPRGDMPNANGVSSLAGSGAGARGDTFDTAARVLGGLAAQIGSWADEAAAIEGAKAGAIAGADPEFRPSTGAVTIRGQAFEKAAMGTYLDKLDAQMRQDIDKIAVANDGNPAGMQAGFATLKQEYRKQHVLPELAGRFDAEFQRATLAPLRQAYRDVETRARAERLATLSADLVERGKSLERSAYFLGLDRTADETLAGELASLKATLSATGADGRAIVSPDDQQRLMSVTSLSVARARVAGTFDRLESVEAKQSFLTKFEADFASGGAQLDALDLRTYEQLKSGMEAEIGRGDVRLKNLLADDIASIRATGRGVLGLETTSLLGAGQRQEWQAERDAAFAYHAATSDMAQLTPAQLEARLVSLEPKAGQEGFAGAAELYNEAAKSAGQILKLREDDPVLAVAGIPQLREAIEAASADTSPAGTQAVARMVLEAQEAVGIPASDRRVLSNGQAASIAATVKSAGASGQTVAQGMQALQVQYGPYWPQAVADLSKDLPGPLLVIAAMDRPDQRAAAETLSEAMAVGQEALQKALPRKAANEIDKSLFEALEPFRKTLVDNPGGERTYASFAGAARLLSMSYVARGESPSTAATRAVTQMLDRKYIFEGTYRIPRDPAIDAGAVVLGTRAALDELGGRAFDLPISLAGLDEKSTRSAYLSALKARGYFVTAPDESGLVLYEGTTRAAVTAGGRPIVWTWAEIEKALSRSPGHGVVPGL
jgi:hypothetical protein